MAKVIKTLKVTAVTPVLHDGVAYAVGEELELPEHQAAQLVACKAATSVIVPAAAAPKSK